MKASQEHLRPHSVMVQDLHLLHPPEHHTLSLASQSCHLTDLHQDEALPDTYRHPDMNLVNVVILQSTDGSTDPARPCARHRRVCQETPLLLLQHVAAEVAKDHQNTLRVTTDVTITVEECLLQHQNRVFPNVALSVALSVVLMVRTDLILEEPYSKKAEDILVVLVRWLLLSIAQDTTGPNVLTALIASIAPSVSNAQKDMTANLQWVEHLHPLPNLHNLQSASILSVLH